MSNNEAWTDQRIREAFIYDGGESEYRDPINGARTQREVAGAIFDAWLAAHDAALLAAPSTPPADDVREALVGCIARDEQDWRFGDFEETSNHSPSLAEYIAEGILANPLFEVRPHGTVTDDYEAGYGEGFHHGRSTPEVRPVTDAFANYVDHLGVDANEDHTGDWWDGYRQAQRENIRRATAALEAAREVHS